MNRSKTCYLEHISLSYSILPKPEPEGGYTVNLPALPGCITHGETLEDAKSQAKEAIELYIESLKAHGEDIPTDAAKSILRQAGTDSE